MTLDFCFCFQLQLRHHPLCAGSTETGCGSFWSVEQTATTEAGNRKRHLRSHGRLESGQLGAHIGQQVQSRSYPSAFGSEFSNGLASGQFSSQYQKTDSMNWSSSAVKVSLVRVTTGSVAEIAGGG